MVPVFAFKDKPSGRTPDNTANVTDSPIYSGIIENTESIEII